MTPPPGTPSDWVSGERVFAPPRGTVDVDWLVPAVLELVPGAAPADARAALERAWAAHRSGVVTPPAPPSPLDAAADRVIAEALVTFGG